MESSQRLGKSARKVSRRQAMTSAAACALLGTASNAAAAGASSRDRPNILWLVSEDNNPFIGAYGDPIARTPNIDGLAKEGVLYRNAFSTAPVCAPSRFTLLTGMYAETCGPAQHMRAEGRLPARVKTAPELLREAGYYCTNNWKTDYNCDADPKKIWDECGAKAQWYNRPDGAPFYAMYSYMRTHESQLFFPTPGHVKPEDVRVPGYLPDTSDVRTDIASYYNLIEKMDAEVGARLKQLEDKGAAEDTIVFYFADNGGVLPRSKHIQYDEGFRTPLIVYIPPKWRHLAPGAPGSVIDTPVSYIDLVPTLLSLIGQPKPTYMQGRALMGRLVGQPERYAFGARDRMDERYDFCRTVCDGRYRLIRNYLRDRPGAGHIAFAWQMKSYQDWDRRHLAGQLTEAQDRFFHTRPYEEFYDLQIDRDELRNLIDDPAHAQKIKAMRHALDGHMLTVNDNGFIPEGAPGEGYDQSRDRSAYPIARVMALAELAGRRHPRNLPAFRAALKDPNPIVRYWGVLGLRFLASDAAPARADLERAMQEDPVLQVQIPAAEALARIGQGEIAVRRLGDILGAPGQAKPLRLQSLDALTYMGPAARGALTEIRLAASEKDSEVSSAGGYLVTLLEGTYRPELPVTAHPVMPPGFVFPPLAM